MCDRHTDNWRQTGPHTRRKIKQTLSENMTLEAKLGNRILNMSEK